MQSALATTPISPKMLWGGLILSLLPALFLLLDGIMKLFKPAPVVEATVKLGYPESVIISLGVILLTATILYLIPMTSVLGAILLVGYLGGAVATHVRVGDGWFPMLFPVVFGILLWGGLHLRDTRLQALLPFTSPMVSTSAKMVWGGRILSALPVLLLCFSASMKLIQPAGFAEQIAPMGYTAKVMFWIGIVEIFCTILYLIPQTAVLGAILLAAYLGGATATHVRVGEAFIAPIVAGVLVWGGLYLRDERIRALIPLRS